MDTIRVSLVDDEAGAISLMKGLLAPFIEVNIVGTAGSVREALPQIAQLLPDMVFTDIQMPEAKKQYPSP